MNKFKTDNLFEQHLNEDDLQKLASIVNLSQLEELVNVLKTAISEKYKQIYETSEKQTLREFFANHIEEIAEDNRRYTSAVKIPSFVVSDVKSGNLKHNIKGFVLNCKDHDALILNVQIQKNMPALKYSEADGAWHETTTTLITLITTAGKYVYVSAINSIKTDEKAAKYLDRVDSYYYYKRRNTNVA